MKRSTPPHMSSRLGFTLVEMLVSMALMMFIMVILVEAFGAGMDTFSGLRAIGDLQEQLRGAAQVIRGDLSQDHFEGGRRCSDANFWDEPRREGFFYVGQKSKFQFGPSVTGAAYYREEGKDLDNVTYSYRAIDHILHFAVRLRGNERDKFFYDSTTMLTAEQITAVNADRDTGYGYRKTQDTSVPPKIVESPILTSQWGEIAYILDAASPAPVIPETVIDPAINPPPPPENRPVPLYNLYRYQFLVIPFTDTVTNKIDATTNPNKFSYTSLQIAGGKYNFFSPNDLARGNRAFKPTSPPPAWASRSLVCSNVVSFQVRLLKSTSGNTGVYEDVDLDSLTGNPIPFDSMTKPASGYRLLGVQVILRIWDSSSGLTRQITIVQDL